MSDSVATPSNVQSLKSATYTDDFHSASPSRLEELKHPRHQPEPSSVDRRSMKSQDHSLGAEVAYRYEDSASRRTICIYAPTLHYSWSRDEGPLDEGRQVNRTARSRQSTGTFGGGDTASYSSNFETVDDPKASASEATSSESDSSDSYSSTGSSGASYLRVMSIDQLTTVEDRFLEDACEHLTRQRPRESATTLTQSPPPSPPPSQHVTEMIEPTARALLGQLHRGRVVPPKSTPSHQSPYLLLAADTLPTTEIPRLTVERLRVDSLRAGARLLIESHSHDTRSCLHCSRERGRLAQAQELRDLAYRARRSTVEHRLRMHHPASVVSREMVHVARNARLVSDWMRTGRVPAMQGLSVSP